MTGSAAGAPVRWCYEQKRYPDGRRNRFRARVLLLQPGRGALHFASDRAYEVGGLHLPRGTVTFGLFWEDRPYNLYAWMAPGLAAPRGLYFNVCDQVTLSAGRFDWRDLWVDVLILPHAAPRVLDRHEIPPATGPGLRAAVDAAVRRVLAEHRAVFGYLRALLPALRSRSWSLPADEFTRRGAPCPPLDGIAAMVHDSKLAARPD